MTLLLLLLAAAPPASKAEALAKARQWEELYLAYAAAKPEELAEAERPRVAKALRQGCEALVESDAVIAFSLAEKAQAVGGTADGALCLAAAGAKSDQRGAAEAALRAALSAAPEDDRLRLALARALLEDRDPTQALALLREVGPKSKQRKEAAALEAKARAQQGEEKSSRAQLTADEKELARNQERIAAGQGPTAPPPKPGARPTPSSGSLTYESGVDGEGRRTRSNQHFRFRYFNGQRDFGERAEYEGRVQAALEVAREAATRILGKARETPTDVILYSKAEFVLHHGAGMAASVAGFYSDSAIRMNDSAEINPQNQATLVHEYVHAVVDEASTFKDERLPVWLNEGLAEWTEWRYLGDDGPPTPARVALRAAAQAEQLPSLSEMNHGPLVAQGNPALRYALSACAVGLMLKDGGSENLFGLIHDVGAGGSFDKIFSERYGKTVERLNEQVAAELKSL
jgi:hypothetical protein